MARGTINRLVYSPKVYAFVKTDHARGGKEPYVSGGRVRFRSNQSGYVDISDYIVSGNVQRVVNAASTATLTLQNPYKIWTQPGDPEFHPMDLITIYASRYKDKPIQILTGYLDEAPYFQLLPNTVTLKASCTLKRLLYTWWDPALPFTQNFLRQYNWIPNPQTGQLQNLAEQMKNLKDTKGKMTDGSLGKLLHAVLTQTELGGWNDNEVFIEELPSDLVSYVQKMYKAFAKEDVEAQQEFEWLLKTIIGTSSQGTGGGNAGSISLTGDVNGADKAIPIIEKIANDNNVPPEMAVTVALIESNLGSNMFTHEPYHGWYQIDINGCRYHPGPITVAQANDLGFSCTLFCRGAANDANNNPNLRNNLLTWAMFTQGVNGQNNPAYPQTWAAQMAIAKTLLIKYGSKNPLDSGSIGPGLPVTDSGTQTKKTHDRTKNATPDTRFAAIKAKAEEIDSKHYPYAWGGGHNPQFDPSKAIDGSGTFGYDCSGTVSAVLHAAGYIDAPMVAGDFVNFGAPGPGRVTIYANPDHVFMSIDGRFFGTSGFATPNGGPAFWTVNPSASYLSKFTQRHPTDLSGNPGITLGNGDGSGADRGGGGQGGTTTQDEIMSTAMASAFATELDFPSLEEQTLAIALQGQKSLMNDKQLMPFIQQLTTASLRQFQSLPNGDFFAFYPDYFGTFGKLDTPGGRKPYWIIRDIEVIDGKIQLTDDNLATHVYVVGDTGVPLNGIDIVDKLLSGGVVTIFNAFESNFVLSGEKDPDGTVLPVLKGKADALRFLQKYGARPYYEEAPFVRSRYFEAFLAFQKFQLMWSRTFLTDFELTFMPELYPGGIVAFEDYGIQCYIDSVTHNFDYESGFTTTASLDAPAAYGADGPSVISKGLVRANANPSDTNP